MTERMLVNRIKKLEALETQKKGLDDQIEALKAEIKADMDSRGGEQQQAGGFVIRWTKVLGNKFDSKAFKAEHEALYSQYLKQTEIRRFSMVTL